MKNIPTPIADATLKYHADLLVSRTQAIQVWDAQIDEIEGFMRKNGIAFQTGLTTTHLAAEIDENPSVATLVKGKAASMILPGVFVSTEDIVRSLIGDGHSIENGKITQILSGTRLYKGHKTKGWSLKGEEQADGGPLASSNATKSRKDEI